MQRRLIQLLWIATFLWVIAACFRPLQFPDLWWQLDEGTQILEKGISEVSIRTFGFAKAPPVNEYLLFECAAAAIYKMSGLPGLWVGLGLLTLAPFCIVGWFLFRSDERFFFGIWICFLLFFLMAYTRIQHRPELAANLCQIALGLFLLRNVSGFFDWRQLGMVAIIFAAWANFHGSFIIGFWMLGLFYGVLLVFESDKKSVLKAAAGTIGASVLGMAFNPDGFKRFLLPFQLVGDFWARELIPEMAAPPALAWPLYFLVVVAVFFLLRPFQRRNLWLALLFLSSLVLGLSSIRYVNLVAVSFGLIFLRKLLPSEGGGLRKERPSTLLATLGTGGALVGVVVLFILESSVFTGTSSYARLDRIGQGFLHDLSERNSGRNISILADPWVGSMACSPATSGLFPLVHTGMSRFQPDTLRYAWLLERNPTAFREALKKLHADYILVNGRNLQWALALSSDSEWTIQAAGSDYAVFGKGRGSAFPNAADGSLERLFFLNSLDLAGQAKALALVPNMRDQKAAWDFLIDWAERQPVSRIEALLPYCQEKGGDRRFVAIFLGTLGRFDQAKKALEESMEPNREIAAWMNLRQQGMVYPFTGSEKEPKKLLDPVWFDEYTRQLNKNLDILRQRGHSP